VCAGTTRIRERIKLIFAGHGVAGGKIGVVLWGIGTTLIRERIELIFAGHRGCGWANPFNPWQNLCRAVGNWHDKNNIQTQLLLKQERDK